MDQSAEWLWRTGEEGVDDQRASYLVCKLDEEEAHNGIFGYFGSTRGGCLRRDSCSPVSLFVDWEPSNSPKYFLVLVQRFNFYCWCQKCWSKDRRLPGQSLFSNIISSLNFSNGSEQLIFFPLFCINLWGVNGIFVYVDST